MTTPIEVVNAFRTRTSASTADIPGALALLTDDMEFVSPLVAVNGKAQYGELMAKLVPANVSTTVHRQFEDGEAVCSIVEATVRAPDGSMIKVPMSELYRFRDGKIARRRLYYDPRELSTAVGTVLASSGDPK